MRLLLVALIAIPFGFAHADDDDFANINPAFYAKIKASSKVALTRNAKDEVIMEYYAYDPDTGALLQQPKIKIRVSQVQALRDSLAVQLSHVDDLLSDISKL